MFCFDLQQAWNDRQRDISVAEKDQRAVACEHAREYRKAEGSSQQDGCCGLAGDLVYIGPDLPDEYTHSNYTMLLRGANAKAKANAAQGIPEMLLIANEREFEKNRKDKHSKNAKYGWYSYVTRFALPVYGENGDIERYNVFRAIMLVRHAEDNKLYLYDIMKIKKETSNLFQSEDLTQ